MDTLQPTLTLNDGHRIPQLGFGTYKLTELEAARMTETALEIGYRHIDTASYYENERGVGRGLRASGVDRDDLFVTSKLWPSEYCDPKAALCTQLEKLGLDFLDLYLIHWPVPKRGTAWDAWKTLLTLRDEGLVRSVGVSNFEVSHLQRILKETGEAPAVNQIELHPEYPRESLREFCQAHQIGVAAWCPIARARQGLFTAPAVVTAAAHHHKTPAQVVLRWHLQRATIAIPKTVSQVRARENFHVCDFALSDEEMTALSALDAGGVAGRIGGDPNEFLG